MGGLQDVLYNFEAIIFFLELINTSCLSHSQMRVDTQKEGIKMALGHAKTLLASIFVGQNPTLCIFLRKRRLHDFSLVQRHFGCSPIAI